MVKNDCGFDVASENEMKSVIQAGVDRSKLVYAHPTRPTEHLRYARENQARDQWTIWFKKYFTLGSKVHILQIIDEFDL